MGYGGVNLLTCVVLVAPDTWRALGPSAIPYPVTPSQYI